MSNDNKEIFEQMKTIYTPYKQFVEDYEDESWSNESQPVSQNNLQLEEGKSQFEIQRMQTEAEIKRQLMAEEFNYQLQLEQVKTQREATREREIEDRKGGRLPIASLTVTCAADGVSSVRG